MMRVLLVVVLVFTSAAIVAGRGGGRPTTASRGLAVAALLLVLVTAGAVFAPAWDDSGLGFASVLVSVPVLFTAAGVVASRGAATAGVVVGWLCVLLLFAYVVVFALGAGLFFTPVALLLLASMLLRRARLG